MARRTKEKISVAIRIGFDKRFRIDSLAFETKASKTMLATNGNPTKGIEIQSCIQATPQIKREIANVPTATMRM